MESGNLTILSNIFQYVLVFVVGIVTAWFTFRGKIRETDATKDIAKINNADDMLLAYGSLQAQLASAAENMVAPLNRQIAEQQKQLNLAHEELKQLRDYVKQKSSEQEQLTRRVGNLETENAFLRGELEKAQRNEARVRQKLERIRKDIDTGELSSGVHKIEEDDK